VSLPISLPQSRTLLTTLVYSQPVPLRPGQDLKMPRLVKTVLEQVTPHLFRQLS